MQPIVPLNVTQGPEKEVTCYLTGGEDELVTGQVRLIAENVGLFHFQLVCDPQKPQQVIVYRHSCNSLRERFFFLLYLLVIQ